MRQGSRAAQDAWDRNVTQRAAEQRRLRVVADEQSGRNALRRSGFLFRQEVRAGGAIAGRTARGTASAAGFDAGGWWALALYMLSTIVLLALLRSMLEGRGPAALEKTLGWTGSAVQRFFSPTDPLIGQGPATSSASSGTSAAAAGGAAVGAAASRVGRLVAVPANVATRAGIRLDAGIAGTAEAIARRFGVRINSGYRDAATNREVGGAQGSDHLKGAAVDYTGSQTALRALYQWAQRQGFPYVEPWSQTGGSHVHISFAR
jgi:hypothetical protein